MAKTRSNDNKVLRDIHRARDAAAGGAQRKSTRLGVPTFAGQRLFTRKANRTVPRVKAPRKTRDLQLMTDGPREDINVDLADLPDDVLREPLVVPGHLIRGIVRDRKGKRQMTVDDEKRMSKKKSRKRQSVVPRELKRLRRKVFVPSELHKQLGCKPSQTAVRAHCRGR